MVLFADVFVIFFVYRFKNIVETVGLRFIGTVQIIGITVEMVVAQIVQQQIELLVERRLRLDVKLERFGGFEQRLVR